MVQRCCWREVWLVGLVVGPLAAFVFVPTRGQVEPRWQIGLPAGPGLTLAADEEGQLYTVTARELTCHENGTGDEAWTVTAPTGQRFAPELVAAGEAMLAVALPEAGGGSATVSCYEVGRADQGRPKVRWQYRGAPPLAGGVHVPFGDGDDPRPLGLVLVASASELTIVRLRDGQVASRTPLGRALTGPVFAASWCFVAVADGPAVLAIYGDPETGRTSLTRLPLPAGPPPRQLRWDQVHHRLLVETERPLYAAEFVLVPTRGEPATTGLVRVGDEAVQQVAGGVENELVLVGDGLVRAVEGPAATERWRFALPTGWQPAEPVRAVGEVMLVPCRQAGGATLRLVALQASSGEQRWEVTLPEVPDGGLTAPTDEDGQPLPLVAVLSGREAITLDAATGEARGRRAVGRFNGPPLWVADSGFVLTADGLAADGQTGGAPALCGFDLPRLGHAEAAQQTWLWRVPKGETVEAVDWLTTGRMLVARTARTAYVFE